MNTELSLSFKITNWCNLRCAHCCEYSGPSESATFLPLEKIEQYTIESVHMPIKPNEYLVLGGGEAMAPYMHNQPDYIPKALDIIYKYGYVPTIKTNGTWGDNNAKRERILHDIAKPAYEYQKLVTLDISVDEFHNNISGVSKIIYNILSNPDLCLAIRCCLVGFNTKKSAIALGKLKQMLQNQGLKISPINYSDWVVLTPNGDAVYVIVENSAGIHDLGRAKEKKVYTSTGNPTGAINCLQIDNNDMAIYNYLTKEPVNNRPLSKVLFSLMKKQINGY